tara:strand:- start:47 stop:463 length:417 start_codon:yes stop_codon:yes gene_type:complete
MDKIDEALELLYYNAQGFSDMGMKEVKSCYETIHKAVESMKADNATLARANGHLVCVVGEKIAAIDALTAKAGKFSVAAGVDALLKKHDVMVAENKRMWDNLEAIDSVLSNERNEGNTLSAIRLCVDAALKGKDDENK